MGRWKITCANFMDVRKQIIRDEKTIDSCKQILEGICSCINDIVSKAPGTWKDVIEFKELRYAIQHDVKSMPYAAPYIAWEGTVNEYLDLFYGLCDKCGVWLGM